MAKKKPPKNDKKKQTILRKLPKPKGKAGKAEY